MVISVGIGLPVRIAVRIPLCPRRGSTAVATFPRRSAVGGRRSAVGGRRQGVSGQGGRISAEEPRRTRLQRPVGLPGGRRHRQRTEAEVTRSSRCAQSAARRSPARCGRRSAAWPARTAESRRCGPTERSRTASRRLLAAADAGDLGQVQGDRVVRVERPAGAPQGVLAEGAGRLALAQLGQS